MRNFYTDRLLKFYKPEDAEEHRAWSQWLSSKTLEELSALYDEAYKE